MMKTPRSPVTGKLLAGLFLAALANGVHAEDIPPLREASTTVDGYDIHYRTAGRGPHLLLLHGFTLTGHQWDPFMAELARHYTVVAVDLPGHGKSTPIDGHFDFRLAAKLMLGLLEALDAGPAFAIGHSAGGITLLHMLRQRPDRLAAAVLVDAPHRFEKEGLDVLRSETFESLSDDLLAFYRGIQPGGDEQIKRLHEQAVWLADDHAEFALSTAELAGIATPALVVWGDRDSYLPVEIGVELYRALPEAELWVVPGQGHAPVFENMGGSTAAAGIFPNVVHRFLAGAVRSTQERH